MASSNRTPAGLPRSAAWQHIEARRGFEVAFVEPHGDEYRVEGETAAVEDNDVWAVRYTIVLDAGWRTLAARVSGRSMAGASEVELRSDGAGHWHIGGEPVPDLDGCMDIDLESSALTNAFPARRLGLALGDGCEAPAAYVRALDLKVERLEQRYLRLSDVSGHERYRYTAPSFGFECELVYDASGLVIAYPGIASRAA
jgi:hypothetical protein